MSRSQGLPTQFGAPGLTDDESDSDAHVTHDCTKGRKLGTTKALRRPARGEFQFNPPCGETLEILHKAIVINPPSSSSSDEEKNDQQNRINFNSKKSKSEALGKSRRVLQNLLIVFGIAQEHQKKCVFTALKAMLVKMVKILFIRN